MSLSTIIIIYLIVKEEKSQQSLSLRTCNLLNKYYRRNFIVLKQKLESELFYHQKLVQNVINCISTLKTRNAPFCFVLFILEYGTYGFHKIPPCLMSIKNDLWEITCECWMFFLSYACLSASHEISSIVIRTKSYFPHFNVKIFWTLSRKFHFKFRHCFCSSKTHYTNKNCLLPQFLHHGANNISILMIR